MERFWIFAALTALIVGFAPAARAQEGLAQQLAALEHRADERGAVMGNPLGTKVLFEFFDYNCPACRGAYGELVQLTRDYPDLKIVLVEWPILGRNSTEAAHTALQNSGPTYGTVYRAIMTGPGGASAARIRTETARAGGAPNIAEADASRELIENAAIARRLGLNAAPGFYINGVVDNGLRGETEKQICGYHGRGTCNSYAVLLADAATERANGTAANVTRYLQRAVADAQRIGSASAYNSVCWQGALLNAAQTVMPACAAAVAADPDNADFRDSRGLARALTGDRAGAAADFQYFVDHSRSAAQVRRRRQAIASLAATPAPTNAALIALLGD